MAQAEVQRLLAAAMAAQRGGDRAGAARSFGAVLGLAPEQPAALNGLGMQALAARDFVQAAALFRRAVAADARSPDLWMNLATACRAQGHAEGEQAALDGALALDQRHFMANVRMAELQERAGDARAAQDRWTGVLAMAAMIEERTPALEALLDHARGYVAGQRTALAATVDAALATARAGLGPPARRRVDACIDHALGRRQIYANQCAGLHVPFLPADEYFDRALFPWLAGLEAQTAAIRAEFATLIASPDPGISPYVAMLPGTPANKWSPLDGRLDWGALHLWRSGVRDDAVCARCPVTAAAIEALPLAHMPGRTPNVFFSILQPGARLPAHTGVSNARAIIHLPLIVPPQCGFRVGGETRAWREGEAWAFDDTIEHEAWNLSDRPRAILILDVWNPHLRPEERDLLQAFLAAIDGHGAADAPHLRVGGD